MKTLSNSMKAISAFMLAAGTLAAQAPNPADAPIYRITVVARTAKAINYNHRSGSTRIGFRGTDLMPRAIGEAKVESKQGVIKIDAEMERLEPATRFGAEYLTYVMWAITPEGRATNVGEVLLSGGKSKLNATTELQSFGLIITAEPYFAVTQPSDVVVMENFVRHDTVGTIEEMDAKYELLAKGQYTLNVNPSQITPMQLDRKVPLELYEARNAVQIARWTGAEHYAGDTYQKAVIGLANAEGYLTGKAGRRPIGTVAREAVQMAEDSRIITVKKIEEQQLASERLAGADREARAERATRAAQSDADRLALEGERARIAAQAEADRVARDQSIRNAAAQTEADRLKRESDSKIADAQSETDRVRRDRDAQNAAAQIEADRLMQQNQAATAAAQIEADRLKRQNDAQTAGAMAEADRLKRENDAQRAATQAALESAASEKARAEAEKSQLRAALLLQFNAVLQTRDTARGLIVNMSDVLFDTAKFSLRPLAREKLAKVAGILAGHPGLQLQVEGYTDSVGGDDYNQHLSENRAGSVRDYLTGAGIPSGSVTAQGFGKGKPVATNDTSAGRQQNRRVELVVSGEIIGTLIRSEPFVAVK
jgi:outer membrane protein OmpA-like peptidoglycan-associated protein